MDDNDQPASPMERARASGSSGTQFIGANVRVEWSERAVELGAFNGGLRRLLDVTVWSCGNAARFTLCGAFETSRFADLMGRLASVVAQAQLADAWNAGQKRLPPGVSP